MAEHICCDNVGLFMFCISNLNILTLALSIVIFEKLEEKLL